MFVLVFVGCGGCGWLVGVRVGVFVFAGGGGCWGVLLAGGLFVGVRVMVGESVLVGVRVMVGVRVIVGVRDGVGVNLMSAPVTVHSPQLGYENVKLAS